LALSVLQILALDIGTDLLPALARAVLARAFGLLGPVEAVASLAMLPVGAALYFGWRPGMPLPAGGPALATLAGRPGAAVHSRGGPQGGHSPAPADWHRANRPEDPEAPDRPRLALGNEDAGPDEVR
jgi:hypothetical protein